MAEQPLTLCIVNHNGERTLDRVLAAVRAQGDVVGEVLLADNASQDGSLALVAARYPEVRVLRLKDNRGPGAARNAGYRAARWDRILFVDNDVELAPGCASLLQRALDADGRAAAAMPRVLYAARPDVIQYDGASSHYLGLMRLHGANTPLEGASAATQAIDSLVTACFLLDRARRGHGEPFDDGIFIFLDDHDFALRTRIAGHRLLSVPEALCWHGAGTLGLSMRDGRRYERRRAFHVICNRWQVLLKSYAPRTLLALAPMLLLFEMVQLAGVVRKGWLREWLAALRWVVAHRGDIAQRRAAVQAERRVSDASILGGGPLPLRDELVLGPLQRAARSIFDRLSSLYWPVARRLL